MDVVISTEVFEKTKFIQVNKYGVVIHDGDTIAFSNQLEGSPTAAFTFYPMVVKGQLGTSIDGFCEGDQTFSINGGETKKCEPTVTGYYAYSVAAEGHKALDPIIIIEPQFNASTFALLLFAAALIAGVLGAFVLGSARGRRA